MNFNKVQGNPLKNEGRVFAECPSNIALIKYWGKYKNQIPANASISFTLKNSFTKTELIYKKSDELEVQVFLSGKNHPKFAEKIKNYFISIDEYLPFLKNYSFEIHTENTFPHSSGIASSASGFGAIAKCLILMRKELFSNQFFENEDKESSFLARLGSGSACRSLYKGLVVWGNHQSILESADEFAIPYPFEVHENFHNYCDTILLIHEGEKSVSSTVGHGLMNNHPYANRRFKEANENLEKLIPILKNGDLNAFVELVEHEALTLHAMMMMSSPAFLLMKPATVSCIEKIWNFRKHTDIPLGFTLDAGANIHLLYPEKDKNHIEAFIQSDLIKFTQNGKIIQDIVEFN
jgi:diphosphomevalonate decarboxylase